MKLGRKLVAAFLQIWLFVQLAGPAATIVGAQPDVESFPVQPGHPLPMGRVGKEGEEVVVELENDHSGSRGRRAVTTVGDAASAGASFYSSTVSYGQLALPDLAGSKKTVLAGDGSTANLTTKVGQRLLVNLPFNFSFFAHQHGQVLVDGTGYLFPHSPDFAPTSHSHSVFEDQLFPISHISALRGSWVVDAKANNSVTVYTNTSFAHFVWSVSVRSSCRTPATNVSCPTAPQAEFSVTLYANGSIAFNYATLLERRVYGNSTPWTGHGQIGLADSSVHNYNVSRAGDISAFRYADIDLSAAYNATATPRSIRLRPANRTFCATALNFAECSHRPAYLACFWCPAHVAYSEKTTPFCTDGKTDRNLVHAHNLACKVEGYASLTKVIHHRYYTTQTIAGKSNNDQSTRKLVFKRENRAHLWEKIELPWDFPYYGHLVRTMFVSSSGEIYPHPGFCALDSNCRLDHWLRTSAIVPLSALWAAVSVEGRTRRGAILRLDAQDNSSVRIVWQNVRRITQVCANCLVQVYVQDLTATFAVELYRDGSIVFDYVDVADHALYQFRSGFGKAQLVDSLFGYPVSRYLLLRIAYETVDRTSLINNPKRNTQTIFFTPLNNNTCNTARNRTACGQVRAALNCLWCIPAAGYAMRPKPFCSDSVGSPVKYPYAVTCQTARIASAPAPTAPPATTPPHARTTGPVQSTPTQGSPANPGQRPTASRAAPAMTTRLPAATPPPALRTPPPTLPQVAVSSDANSTTRSPSSSSGSSSSSSTTSIPTNGKSASSSSASVGLGVGVSAAALLVAGGVAYLLYANRSRLRPQPFAQFHNDEVKVQPS